MATCQPEYVQCIGRPVLAENTQLPLAAKRADLPAAIAVANVLKMQQAPMLGRRVRLRIQPEIYYKPSVKSWAYHRLTRRYMHVSLANVEQANLFIDAVFTFIEQLNGKLLAPVDQTK